MWFAMYDRENFIHMSYISHFLSKFMHLVVKVYVSIRFMFLIKQNKNNEKHRKSTEIDAHSSVTFKLKLCNILIHSSTKLFKVNFIL